MGSRKTSHEGWYQMRIITAVFIAFLLTSTIVSPQNQAKKPPAHKSLNYVAGLAGKDECDLISSEPLHSRLKTLMGADYQQFDIRWGMCGTPANMVGGIVIAINMQPHYGGMEESMLAVDPKMNAIMVKILHNGKIYTYQEVGHPLTLPDGWMGTQDEWSKAVEVGGRVRSSRPQMGPNS